MATQSLSKIDEIIVNFDRALRSLTQSTQRPNRPSPAIGAPTEALDSESQRHSVGLMRVNHAGEVCAQALYQGQATTAKLDHIRDEMTLAADDEMDHLSWCEQRLDTLGGSVSKLNPMWYAMSFSLGAAAGLAGDKISLGFVAATEEQVSRHLQKHLETLPLKDHGSRAIVAQMLEDEEKHAKMALDAGGKRFPKPVKAVMSLVSGFMTKSSYYV